jgi:hypothetical protein
MRRLLLAGFTFFSLAAFAMGGKRPEAPNNPNLPNPEPYQTQFKALGKTYGAAFAADSVVFSFRTFFGGVIGMCTFTGRTNKVEFSPGPWANNSDTFREMLAFHELGHCLLGRGHKNSSHSDGRPESIMKAVIFSEKTYLAYREEYLKELFTAGTQVRAISGGIPNHDFGDCKFGR